MSPVDKILKAGCMKPKLRAIWDVGVAAADPVGAVERALPSVDLGDPSKLTVVAVGKAAPNMIAPVLAQLTPKKALVVTHRENQVGDIKADVMRAGHPVPDPEGEAAANAICDLAEAMGRDEHLLILISGGASAMLPAPRKGITLQDKIRVTEALLASGAPIEVMNIVRQQLSRIKGGGLARLASPAKVTALVLSDVIGDDLRAVASGPTLPPLGTPKDAIEALRSYFCWGKVGQDVRNLLHENQDLGPVPKTDTRIISSNSKSVEVMAEAAKEGKILTPPLLGDVTDASERLAALPSGLWLIGGECTVQIKGKGKGGRNQELALRMALIAEREGWPAGWTYLQGGSDGRDGPTDAAGAIVNSQTLKKMRAAGVDPVAALKDNDSYHALKAAGDLLVTEATGTNVADLGVLYKP